MKLKALNNTFVFTFVDPVNSKGEFERESTASGIVLKSNFDESAKSPRWVNVVVAGDQCKKIKAGMQVLLPNLRWTIATKFLGERVWRSDEAQAVAYRESPTSEVVPMDDVVLFTPVQPERSLASGIIVMGAPEDTPRGRVLAIGSKVFEDLNGSTILYNDTNFTDTIRLNGKEVRFIREDAILAFE